MKSEIGRFFYFVQRRPLRGAAIAYWFVAGRRVRARGRLKDGLAALPFVYRRWLKDKAALDAATLADLELRDERGGGTDCWRLDPRREFGTHVHITAAGQGDAMTAIQSVLAQTWPHWRLFVTMDAVGTYELPADPRIIIMGEQCRSPAKGLRAALETASTPYLVPVPAGCRLPREALAAYAADIGTQVVGWPVIYGDQDEQAGNGPRANPWFKPDWDSDMILAQDYVTSACALPVAAARRVARGTGDDVCAAAGDFFVYALLLRLVAEEGQEVRHVYRVTVSTPPSHWCRPCPERLAVLRQAMLSDGVEVSEGAFGTAKIHWPLPDPLPRVSIIIPTRDRLDILRPCIDSVLAETRYENFEIIIADNGSVDPAATAYLRQIDDDPRVRVVSWPHPYNYSAINNFAVRSARGDFICLLNNDTEIIDGAWLGELMRQACRHGIGAVGARLLYPDRSIQHAGVVVGLGNAAGHAHRGLADGEPGYFAHALIARGATAVTAACLVVSRALYDAVGGLDEEHLRIAYNDVDLCLKLRQSGVRNIYAPDAVLIHHESKSRGLDMAPEHRQRYFKELATLQQRWDTTRFQDPMHHPDLNRSSERYLT